VNQRFVEKTPCGEKKKNEGGGKLGVVQGRERVEKERGWVA